LPTRRSSDLIPIGDAGDLHQLRPPRDRIRLLRIKSDVIATRFSSDHRGMARSSTVPADDHVLAEAVADLLDSFSVGCNLNAVAQQGSNQFSFPFYQKSGSGILCDRP